MESAIAEETHKEIPLYEGPNIKLHLGNLYHGFLGAERDLGATNTRVAFRRQLRELKYPVIESFCDAVKLI